RSRRATDLDDVDAELGEQRGVAVREPDLHLVAGVAIRDRGHRRCAPDVGRIEGDAPAGDVGLAAPADAEADSGGVLAYRCRLLARQQHLDGDFDAGCQPQAGLLRPRVRDQRATPAVARWGDAGQPVDLGLDRLPGGDQRLPPRNRSRQCSMSSDANRRAWSMLSVTIRSHRSTTPASSSARSGVMAPTALMWEPGSTMSVCRMGAVARVTSVMTRAPATASATDGAATTGTRSSSLTCAANA